MCARHLHSYVTLAASDKISCDSVAELMCTRDLDVLTVQWVAGMSSYHLDAEEGQGMVSTVKCKLHLNASKLWF